MRAVFDKKELLILLRDFYELTGIRTVVFDAWGVDCLSYPAQLPDFCRMVRRTEAGRTACLLCDQNACRRALQRQQTVIYPCHAGLIEVITPILVDGAAVGYLLLSHIVQGADEDAEWRFARQCCEKYALPEPALREAYLALPRTPYQKLRAAADLLALTARAMYKERLARLVPGSMGERLNLFLEEHLAEPLSSERICNELSVGRTKLYHLSMEQYGCGIAQHITQLRIQRAIDLLTSTRMSITEISNAVGISDVNYFFRLFRKHTGLTPKSYRSNLGNGAPT